jgi:hypothetical protein
MAAALDERGADVSQLWSGQIGVLNATGRGTVSAYGPVFRNYATVTACDATAGLIAFSGDWPPNY